MDPTLESVKELKVVEIKPGDILVVRSELVLLEQEKTRICDQVVDVVRNACGAEVGVIVLDRGVDLAVLREAAEGKVRCPDHAQGFPAYVYDQPHSHSHNLP